MNYNQIISSCINKWPLCKHDTKISYFSSNFRTWIDQFPIENQYIYTHIINNLDYYSHSYLEQIFKQLHNEILVSITMDYTICMPLIKKTEDIKTSKLHLYEYMITNNISPHNIYENFIHIPNNILELIQNIIFIDDFSGTALSIITFFDEYLDKIKNKCIFLVIIHIMDDAYKKLIDYGKKNNLKLTILYHTKKSKFSEKHSTIYGDLEKNTLKTDSFSKNIPKKYIFGFKKSESNCAFYTNTPNNSFGIIWYPYNSSYIPLFPRLKSEEPPFITGFSNKQQKDDNYTNKINGGNANGIL